MNVTPTGQSDSPGRPSKHLVRQADRGFCLGLAPSADEDPTRFDFGFVRGIGVVLLDVTAILAGVAALTGIIAIVSNLFMQHRQHSWQERQEANRRTWERDEERERRRWQEEQLVGTRWDERKRLIYIDFISDVDTLFQTTSDLRSLWEDLSNGMSSRVANFRGFLESVEPDRFSDMTAEEVEAHWEDRRADYMTQGHAQRTQLEAAEAHLIASISRWLAEIDLIAPDQIRTKAKELANLSKLTIYGSDSDSDKYLQRGPHRNDFIEAVRNDFRIQLEG